MSRIQRKTEKEDVAHLLKTSRMRSQGLIHPQKSFRRKDGKDGLGGLFATFNGERRQRSFRNRDSQDDTEAGEGREDHFSSPSLSRVSEELGSRALPGEESRRGGKHRERPVSALDDTRRSTASSSVQLASSSADAALRLRGRVSSTPSTFSDKNDHLNVSHPLNAGPKSGASSDAYGCSAQSSVSSERRRRRSPRLHSFSHSLVEKEGSPTVTASEDEDGGERRNPLLPPLPVSSNWSSISSFSPVTDVFPMEEMEKHTMEGMPLLSHSHHSSGTPSTPTSPPLTHVLPPFRATSRRLLPKEKHTMPSPRCGGTASPPTSPTQDLLHAIANPPILTKLASSASQPSAWVRSVLLSPQQEHHIAPPNHVRTLSRSLLHLHGSREEAGEGIAGRRGRRGKREEEEGGEGDLTSISQAMQLHFRRPRSTQAVNSRSKRVKVMTWATEEEENGLEGEQRESQKRKNEKKMESGGEEEEKYSGSESRRKELSHSSSTLRSTSSHFVTTSAMRASVFHPSSHSRRWKKEVKEESLLRRERESGEGAERSSEDSEDVEENRVHDQEGRKKGTSASRRMDEKEHHKEGDAQEGRKPLRLGPPLSIPPLQKRMSDKPAALTAPTTPSILPLTSPSGGVALSRPVSPSSTLEMRLQSNRYLEYMRDGAITGGTFRSMKPPGLPPPSLAVSARGTAAPRLLSLEHRKTPGKERPAPLVAVEKWSVEPEKSVSNGEGSPLRPVSPISAHESLQGGKMVLKTMSFETSVTKPES